MGKVVSKVVSIVMSIVMSKWNTAALQTRYLLH
jgi:hypothetical protein